MIWKKKCFVVTGVRNPILYTEKKSRKVDSHSQLAGMQTCTNYNHSSSNHDWNMDFEKCF